MAKSYIRFSSFLIDNIFKFYISLEKDEMLSVSEIAHRLNYDATTIRRFINCIDNDKNINGEFFPEYKLILKHTIFRKDNTEGSHYSNQQEYFRQLEEKRQRREKAKQIALSLYNRQQVKGK